MTDATDPRHAELARQKGFLEALFRAIPDLVWLKDPDGVYLACNRAFERFFGHPEASIVGRTDYDFVPRALADSFRENDRAAMAAGKPTHNEEWITFAEDGRRALVRTTKTPMVGAGGELIGVLGIAHDITELRRQEEALREEKRMRGTIMESMPGVAYALDASGRLVFWNRHFEEVTGRAPDELLGMSALELFEGEDRAQIAERIGQVFAGGESDAEAELVAKDGRRIPIYFTGRRIEIGGAPHLVGAGVDIGARRSAEQALRRLNDELEARVRRDTADLQASYAKLRDNAFAMDVVGIGIHWVDFESGRLVYVNRHAAELLGYTPEEMMRLRIPDIDALVPEAEYREIVGRLREQGHLKFDSEQIRRDGTRVPVEVTIYYHEGDETTRPRVISFVQDITERKRTEQALREAKVAAESASRAKSAFLANLSHEIRTPLNAILGLNHLMQAADPPAGQAERLRKMEVSSRHLLSIINDILDLSKIEAGRMELETGNFHLSAVIDNVASIVREAAAAKGLSLEVDPDGVPPWLRGDATRLRQALLNLASNAVKFTERGSVAIRAVLLGEADARIRVRFEVADTGIGISEAQMSRLFRHFQQADGSTARKYGGTGLGLALTKRLVEMMDGEVGVDSVPGRGSTFWFTVALQRGHGPLPLPAEADPVRAGEDLLRQRHRGARILLAEDNPINTEVVQQMLDAAGLAVSVAANGRVALDRAGAEAFDLVLMDMQMPEMDGLEATRALRRLPRYAATPILALTANAFAEDRRACLEAGMNDVLTKPVDPVALYQALARWLPVAATRVSEESIPRSLRELPGLEVSEGLRHVGGQADRYLRFLRRFGQTLGEDLGALREHVAAGEREAAERIAHSIKGAAGTLGLERLSRTAQAIERRLKDPDALPGEGPEILAMAVDIAAQREALVLALPPLPAATPARTP